MQSRWQRIGPVLTLIVLSPFIAELLSGATRLSVIYVLVPEVMTWGCGALIIRELVRRWQGGWASLLLLAPTIAIAEEIIIQQTSLAPLAFAGSNASYGRMFGVNWAWLLAMLVFETFAVVLVPVQLTELAFRGRRNAPWLRTRGFVIAGIVFLMGAFLAWFAWTQNYRIKILHLAPYHPPVLYVLGGLAAIVLLGVASYSARLSKLNRERSGSKPVPALVVGIVSACLAYPWQFVIALSFDFLRNVPFWIAALAAVAYAVIVFFILRRISSAAGWSDLHRFAVCTGATIALMAWGVINLWHGARVDFIGEMIFIAIGLAFLAGLGRRLDASAKASQAEQKTYA